MRLLRDRYGGTLRGQHPYRNLQSLPNWIHDGNRTVAPLGAANNLENSVAERMKRIEDLHALIFSAQGIVGADGCIPTCIVSSPVAESRSTARAGSAVKSPASFSPSAYSVSASGKRSCDHSATRLETALCIFTAN